MSLANTLQSRRDSLSKVLLHFGWTALVGKKEEVQGFLEKTKCIFINQVFFLRFCMQKKRPINLCTSLFYHFASLHIAFFFHLSFRQRPCTTQTGYAIAFQPKVGRMEFQFNCRNLPPCDLVCLLNIETEYGRIIYPRFASVGLEYRLEWTKSSVTRTNIGDVL